MDILIFGSEDRDVILTWKWISSPSSWYLTLNHTKNRTNGPQSHQLIVKGACDGTEWSGGVRSMSLGLEISSGFKPQLSASSFPTFSRFISYFSSLHSSVSEHQPPSCPSDLWCLPQGLCTCASLSLECSSPRDPHAHTPAFFKPLFSVIRWRPFVGTLSNCNPPPPTPWLYLLPCFVSP